MKKQYLISLLGLAAISVPLGSSLLETNTKLLSPVIDPTSNTGLTIQDSSEVVVFDTDGKNGKASSGDQLQSISFTTKYVKKDNIDNWNSTLSDSIHIYDNEDIEHKSSLFDITTKEVSALGDVNKKANGIFFNIELNSADNATNEDSLHNNFWNYKLSNTSGFDITLDSLSDNYPNETSIDLGTVQINPVSIDKSVSSKIEPVGQAYDIKQKTAKINYELDLGKDVIGSNEKIEKIEWIDADKGVIATDTKADGTLEATDLDEGITYNTTIKVTMIGIGNNVSSTETINPFTTKVTEKNPTVEVVQEPYDITTTSAKVDYLIDPGYDENNNIRVIDTVKWMDGEDELDTKTTPSPHGTLEATNLDENVLYEDTTIVLTMLDGSGETIPVTSFKTLATPISPSISEVALDYEYANTYAIVNYKVDLGINEDGSIPKIEHVEWKDLDSSEKNEILAEDEWPTSDQNGFYSLRADELPIGTDYNNTQLIVTMSDTEEVKKSVDPFTTKITSENPDIKASDEVVISRNKDEATVDFSVDHGVHVDGTGATTEIEEIEWIAENGETVLADEHETTSATNGKVTLGSITAVDLTEETDYNNTKLVVTMNDGSSDDEVVSDFTTKTDEVVEPVAPEVNEPTHVYTDTENNKIQVQGKVTPNDGTVTSVELLDKDNKVVATDDSMSKARGDVSYDLIASNYSGNVEDYTIRVNYKNAAGKSQIPLESETIDPDSDVIEEKDLGDGSVDPDEGDKTDKLGAGAVIAIIIAVLLGVGIIAWVGNLLYKKYKEDQVIVNNDDEDQKEDQELAKE